MQRSHDRDIIFDILKGITILCVLIGHSKWAPWYVNRFIFSFHMPLFFIVAGYFTHLWNGQKQTLKEMVTKNFRRLVIPYILTSVLALFVCLVQNIKNHSISDILHEIIGYSLCLDTAFEGTLFDSYPAPVWFLLALFWAKLLFWILSKYKKWLLPVSFVISYTMVLIHPYLPLPWGIGEGIQGLVFVTLGYYVRHRDEYINDTWWRVIQIGLAILWILTFKWGTINMIFLDYKCFPVDMLSALGGTLVMLNISKIIAHTKLLSKALAWCGENSLYILCAHSVEMRCNIIHFALIKANVKLPLIIYYGIRHALAILCAGIYSIFKYRKTYNKVDDIR